MASSSSGFRSRSSSGRTTCSEGTTTLSLLDPRAPAAPRRRILFGGKVTTVWSRSTSGKVPRACRWVRLRRLSRLLSYSWRPISWRLPLFFALPSSAASWDGLAAPRALRRTRSFTAARLARQRGGALRADHPLDRPILGQSRLATSTRSSRRAPSSQTRSPRSLTACGQYTLLVTLVLGDWYLGGAGCCAPRIRLLMAFALVYTAEHYFVESCRMG